MAYSNKTNLLILTDEEALVNFYPWSEYVKCIKIWSIILQLLQVPLKDTPK